MAIKLNNGDISALYLGSQAVSAAYLGSSQVFSAGGGGGGSDPDFASVSLLLHFDGATTTFTDSSSSPKTLAVTPNGAFVTQTTGESKFGGSSVLFQNGGGTTGSLKADGASPGGTEDFTLEFWHLYDNAANPYYYSQYIAGTTTAVKFELETYRLVVGGSTVMTYSLPAVGQWYHGALVRDGNTYRFYRDGVQIASGTDSSSLSSTDLYIGSSPFLGSSGIIGSHLDDLRVTRGVCRYPGGTTFTPPTAAFPDS